MNFEHDDRLDGIFGHGLALREEPDGFYGSFEIHGGSKGDTALSLIHAGALTGVSVEAQVKRTPREGDGVVRRRKAHLKNIALCRNPAYEDAVVLAVREEPEIEIEPELLPLDLSQETIERCRRLGIQLPERYKAHPAATGTPDNTGTPEDGTRLTDQATATSEEKGDAHSH